MAKDYYEKLRHPKQNIRGRSQHLTKIENMGRGFILGGFTKNRKKPNKGN